MQQVTNDDFRAWRESPVTKAFFLAANERIQDAMYSLSTSAGMDLVQDNFMRGFILAYRELEGFRIEDLQGAED